MKYTPLSLSKVLVQNATLVFSYLSATSVSYFPVNPRLRLDPGIHRVAALTSTPRSNGDGGSSRKTTSQPVAHTSSGHALVSPARYRDVVHIYPKKSASTRSSGKLKNSVSRYSATSMDSLPPRKEPVELHTSSELSVLGTSIEKAHGVEHGFVKTQVDNIDLFGQRADQFLSRGILEATGSNRGGECQARNQSKQVICHFDFCTAKL